MSDRLDLADDDSAGLDLLDRAATLSPHMSVEPEAVIAAGRRKVRRRRTSAVGVGALTLAGALWLGGPLNPLTATNTVVPASVDWRDGVEVQFLDNLPAPSEAGRTHWTGELRSGEGDALPDLILTQDGEQLEPIAAQDGPGDVLVFPSDQLVVAVWESPEGSRAERELWSHRLLFGQGGTFEVDGAELNYASAEFAPGVEGELTELYWFTDTAAHAASGAPVESVHLSTEDAYAVLMVDESRGVWGALGGPVSEGVEQQMVSADLAEFVHGAGRTGWTGDGIASAAVGILPEGATVTPASAESTAQVQAALGSRTAVLASSSDAPPTIHFTLAARESTLDTYVDTAGILTVAGKDVRVKSTPKGLQLSLGARSQRLIPNADLGAGTAIVGSVAGGRVVVVPGWEPGAPDDALRVQLGSGSEPWVRVDAVQHARLFDGTPVVILGVAAGVLSDGKPSPASALPMRTA